MLGDFRDVLRVFAQGRDVDLDHLQAEVEVCTKRTFTNRFLEVTVGGGHDTDVDGDRLAASNPLEGLAFEDAEEFRLDLGLISPISSRNRVPSVACSNLPAFWPDAPVKAPFS